MTPEPHEIVTGGSSHAAAAVGSIVERTVPGLTPALKRRAQRLFRVLGACSPWLAARLAAYVFVRPRGRTISDDEQRFLATAHARRLRTAAGVLQVYEWPGARATVLVLHGWISNAARMQPIIESLLRLQLRVVAFDAPAHGRSSGRWADLQRFQEGLTAVSRACGPVQALLAHSFGAMAAASWLADSPAAAGVRAAVLIGMPRDVGYLLDSFTITMKMDERSTARLRELFHRRYGRFPEQYSSLDLAPRIRAPVLLVHGSEDELVPLDQARQIAQALPGARLHVVHGFNHSGPLRDDAAIAVMSGFIADRL